MNKEIIPIFVLTAAIMTAITTMSTITPAAIADKSSGSNGLEKADQNVHENTGGLGSSQDFNFHVGTCQGGHTTTALNNALGGCDNVPSPSEFHSPQH